MHQFSFRGVGHTAFDVHQRLRIIAAPIIDAAQVAGGAFDVIVIAPLHREIECLQWVASGKTDWEIGRVLGIAAATAH